MWKWLKKLFGSADLPIEVKAPLGEEELERYFSTNPNLTAEDIARLDEPLRAKFVELAEECGLLTDGVAEYHTDAYQPNDFCYKAFEYCGEQFDVTNTDEMAYEYAVIPFYGAIYSVACLAECAQSYKAARSVWDVVAKRTEMEFVPIRVREALGVDMDDPRAKEIYGIITRYMNEASNEAIVSSGRRHVVILKAMRYAYKLGMLVARRELSVDGAAITKEAI